MVFASERRNPRSRARVVRERRNFRELLSMGCYLEDYRARWYVGGEDFMGYGDSTRSENKVMRLIQYDSVLAFKLQIEFVPFKIVPLGGYTPPDTLFPLFVATLVVANRNRV